ncbi:MAG: nucleotidyl transferase AbiEii/AbiGii toxin family protein [Bacteroidia bacterium]
MLQWEAVRPELSRVLKKVSSNPDFSEFFLVGGTALALMIGHRISVDLDFFTREEVDFKELAKTVVKNFPEANVFEINKGGLNVLIDGVKVDFVRHDYPFIKPLETIEGIRLLSKIDIALQKVNAIVGRASKKDFFDLYFLLKEYSLQEIIEGYQNKYGNVYASLIIRSMMWFEDAEGQPDPEVFEKISWNHVKDSIREVIYKNANDFNA